MDHFRFKKTSTGCYNVLVPGTTGFAYWQLLGAVYKYERRYNLRRVLVERGWKIYGSKDTTVYRTRLEAAKALLASAG